MLQPTICSLPKPLIRLQRIFHPEAYFLTRHSHADWQLTAAAKGTFDFTLPDGAVKLRPGEWVLISPMLFHDFGSRSRNSVAFQIFFHCFPPDFMPDFAARFNDRRRVWRKGRIPTSELQALQRRFDAVLPEDSFCRRTQAAILGLDFIAAALAALPREPLPAQPVAASIRRAIEFMETHCGEPAGVGDFAAAARLSEGRFSHIFQEQIGIPPMAYFNSIRLRIAENMLMNDHTVAETAAACGFSSAQYFCRFFRKNTGRTPKSYRKSFLQ